MTDASPLAGLLERLEAATGPDREIDAAMHVALVKPEQYADDLRYFRLPTPSMDYMEMCAPGTYWLKQRSGASLHTAPLYTASIDAIVALIERVLPGWELRLAPRWAQLKQWDFVHSSTGATTAIAACIALIRAKLSEEKANV